MKAFISISIKDNRIISLTAFDHDRGELIYERPQKWPKDVIADYFGELTRRSFTCLMLLWSDTMEVK